MLLAVLTEEIAFRALIAFRKQGLACRMIMPTGAEERSRRVVTVVATEEIFLVVVDAVRAELCAGLLLAADTTRFADDSHIRLLGARWGTASANVAICSIAGQEIPHSRAFGRRAR